MCLSVMCLQPEDTAIGYDRIKKKVLTDEKIIRRWESLYNNTVWIHSCLEKDSYNSKEKMIAEKTEEISSG